MTDELMLIVGLIGTAGLVVWAAKLELDHHRGALYKPKPKTPAPKQRPKSDRPGGMPQPA